MSGRHADAITELARVRGVIRPRDVEELGVHRKHLQPLVEAGTLERAGRGLYRLADAPLTGSESVAEVAKRVPAGVLCLLSALAHHGLTTQSPSEVWLAIGHRAWAPANLPARTRIVRMNDVWMRESVDDITIDGVPTHVTNPARTIVDCFRFRSVVGTDVAIEALRDGWRQRQFTTHEILELARKRRVLSIVQPYLEAISS